MLKSCPEADVAKISLQVMILCFILASDLDPEWLYPIPDPKNLMKTDPPPGQKITKFISNHFFNLYLKLRD